MPFPPRVALGAARALSVLLFLVASPCAEATDDAARVTLLDAEGRSVDSALIVPYCPVQRPEGTAWEPCGEGVTVAAGPDGTLSLPCGRRVSADAFVIQPADAPPIWLEEACQAGGPVVEVQLPAGGKLEACMAPARDPAPVGVARATLDAVAGFPAGVSLSLPEKVLESDGCARWSSVPDGTGTVEIHALGHQPGLQPVSVESGSTHVLPAVTLSAERAVGLRVVDDRGRPVPHPRAALRWNTGHHRLDNPLESHRDLALVIPAFTLGSADLSVEADCCIGWTATSFAFEDIRRLGPIRLVRHGGISGRCVGEEYPEAGLAEAEVCASLGGVGAEEPVCTRTDAGGGFLLDRLAPGRYTLSVRAEGRPRFQRTALEVMPGAVAGAGPLVLPRGATLKILVLDHADGLPVEDATLTVEAGDFLLPDAEWRSSRTDAEGMAELRGLEPGRIALTVASPRHAPRWVELLADPDIDETHEVELTAGGMVAGHVNSRGAPAEGDLVQVRLRTGTRSDRTSWDGKYELPHLPPGRVTVERYGSEGRVERRDVEIEEDRTTVVDFGAGASVHGQVTRGGTPVVGATLSLLRVLSWEPAGASDAARLSAWDQTGVRPASSMQNASTSLSGEYRLDGLEPGGYSLTLHRGDSVQTRLLEIVSEGEHRVDVALDAVVLRGLTLSDRDGQPLAGTQVLAEPARGPERGFAVVGSFHGGLPGASSMESARTRSDANGYFELDLPRTGDWSVMAFQSTPSAQFAMEPQVISVGPPGDRVELRLHRQTVLNVWIQAGGGTGVAGVTLHSLDLLPGLGVTGSTSRPATPDGRASVRGNAGEPVHLLASHRVLGPSCLVTARYPETGEEDYVLALPQPGGVRLETAGSAEAQSWSVTDPSTGISLDAALDPPRELREGDRVFLEFPRLPPCPLVVKVGETAVAVTPVSGQTITVPVRAR
jgi:hypothetical protein